MEKEQAVETDKNIGDTKITQTKTGETTDKHTSVTSACCPQIISGKITSLLSFDSADPFPV